MADAPKILTMRFEAESSKVIFDFGPQQMEKKIPEGHGVLRASMIIHGNTLSEVELITQQNT